MFSNRKIIAKLTITRVLICLFILCWKMSIDVIQIIFNCNFFFMLLDWKDEHFAYADTKWKSVCWTYSDANGWRPFFPHYRIRLRNTRLKVNTTINIWLANINSFKYQVALVCSDSNKTKATANSNDSSFI